MKLFFQVTLIALLVMAVGCSFSTTAKEFNGLPGYDGKKTAHLTTTNYAMNFVFLYPFWGDASVEETVSDFTAAAKEEGAAKVSICQSDSMTLWFIFPPISFFIHPVITNVAGDIVYE